MKYINNIKINKQYLLLSVLLVLSNLLFAQQYPVNVNTNILTPMPSKLTHFYTDNVQKLFVILTNKDMANPSVPVKLKITIIGSSTQIVSRVGSEIGVTPILLDAGVPKTLTQQDLAPYFNINNLDFVGGFSKSQYTTTGVLPEGNYSICIQVLDYYNNRPLSNPMCSYASIYFSQPPNLLTPLNNNIISGQDNKVINFNWTPNHLNNRDVVAGGYKYIFTLKEILDSTQNINQAYLTANNKLTEEVSNNQFILNTMTTPLISGRKYAWTVQVKANNPEAQSTLSNDGISQIFGFTYDDNCLTPQNIIANIAKNKVTISWQNVNGSTVSSIKYKEIDGVEYVKNILPNTNTITLEDLNYQTAYEFAMVIRCGSNILVLDSKQFRVPAKPIAQKAVYKNKVYWSIKEGSQSDYLNTNVSLKTIFQGTSTKTIEKLLPNNKFGLKTKLNDTTNTLSNITSGIIAQKKVLSGAKITLFENGEVLQSVIANSNGEFEMSIDTERIMDNKHLRYYVKYEQPNQQIDFNNNSPIVTDSILLSSMATGSDILKALTSKEIVLASPEFTIIHPVVYVGQNQSNSSHRKAGGVVEVFIKTNDKSSLSRRVLGYTESSQNNESYNGESYTQIGKLTDSKAFLPLVKLNEGEMLLFKVSLNGFPTQYYPLSTLPKNGDKKIINIPLDYNPLVSIQGKVYKNAQKQLEGLNKSGVTAYNKTTNTIIDATTTNSDGTYVLYNIPFSQMGNIVLNAAPFNEFTKKVDNTRSSNNYTLAAIDSKTTSITQDVMYDKLSTDIIYGQAISSESKKAISNVIILYGDIKIGKTTEDGFFAFKLNPSQKDPSKFKIVCDGKVLDSKVTIQFIQQKFGDWERTAKTTAYSKSDENRNQANSELLTQLINQSKAFGDESRRTVSVLLDTLKENLGNYYLANINIAEIFRYKAAVTLRGVKQNVVLYDVERNQQFRVNPKDTTFYFDVNSWKSSERYIFYTVLDTTTPFRANIERIAKDDLKQTSFKAIRKALVFFSKNSPSVTLGLTSIINIKGVTKDSASGNVIDSVTIVADGLSISTASNKKGEYNFSLGETSEVKLLISKKGYYSKDTIVKIGKLIDNTLKADIRLKKIPNAAITQLSGYKVKITDQQFIKDTIYKISGQITLDNDNNIFNINNKTNTLTFSNIEVRVNTKGNATPVIDSVKFSESQIEGKMFKFPIVVNKIQLRRKMNNTPFTTGVITGIVTVKASSFKKENPNFPFAFGDATLQIPDNTRFIYVLTSDDKDIKAFDDKDAKYFLRFDKPGESAGVVTKPEDKQGHVKNTILKNTNINSSKDSCFISKKGITLTGDVALPTSLFTGKNSDNSQSVVGVRFGDLLIDSDFKVKDLTIDMSKAPLITNVNKWELHIEAFKLFGLNQPNEIGLGFGGKLYLTKPTKNTKDTMKNVMRIKTFEIKGSKEGNLQVLAKFIPPPGDINVKTLKFIPANNKEIELGYTEKDGFVFSCAGKITSSDSTSSFAKITKKIFPLEVDIFKIKSKNWAVFASVKPNTNVDFKGVKVSVTRAVLNVGTKMTMNDMSQYVEGKEPIEEPDSPDALDIEAPSVAWAFGISGGVEFGRPELSKGNSGSAKTSFIVGDFNNKIDFRINDVDIEFKSPSAELKAKVKFKLSGDSIGIAGAGKIKIGGFELDTASFHYYKIKDKDVAIGAMLRVPVNGFTTGPISWYSLGGGFSFNSASNSIEAYFTGTAGPAGTTKMTTTGYVDIEKLGVLFKLNECGAKPILQGRAHVFMRKPGKTDFDKWGTMDAKVDFCKNMLLVTAKGSVKDYLPGVDVSLDGLLYGAVSNGKGALLLAVNGNVKAGEFLNVSGQIAMGINYNNDMNGLPNEVREIYKTIPADAKSGNNNAEMNALVVKVNRTVSSGDQNKNFSAGPVNVSARFVVNQAIDAGLLANFSTNTYKVNMGLGADISGTANCSLFGYGFDAGFRAYVYAQLTGGYNTNDGFNVRGDFSAGAEGSVGCCGASCNSVCGSVYWLGACGGVKACVNVSLSAGWSQKRGFSIY